MNQASNPTSPKPKLNFSLWNQLETKKITREQLSTTLFKKLGEPKNELQTNLCQELIKKIISYYFIPQPDKNYTICSVIGWVAEIIQKQRKEGPKKGQNFYVLILNSKDKLHAYQENLKTEQWTQITKLALLGQNLVFQYRKSFFNKEILDWYPTPKKGKN